MLKGDYSEQLFAARHCKSFPPTSVPSKWKKPPEVLSHPNYPGTPKRLPSLPQSPPLPHCRAARGSHWVPRQRGARSLSGRAQEGTSTLL